jgi:Protein of unknown function (DUF1091)
VQPATGEATLIKMSFTVNQNYGRSNFSLYEESGEQFVDAQLNLTKELKLRTMVDVKIICFHDPQYLFEFLQIVYQISKVLKGRRTKLMALPVINFCDFLTSVSVVPVLSNFFKAAAANSNFVKTCPFKPGFYYLKRFQVNGFKESFPLPQGIYHSLVKIMDYNVKRVDVLKVELELEQF